MSQKYIIFFIGPAEMPKNSNEKHNIGLKTGETVEYCV